MRGLYIDAPTDFSWNARRADVEQWTANNFFKSKWGHRKVLRLAMPKVRQSLRALAEECAA